MSITIKLVSLYIPLRPQFVLLSPLLLAKRLVTIARVAMAVEAAKEYLIPS